MSATARILLGARGGSTFATPDPPVTGSEFEVTAAPQGAWPSATQALYRSGVSYFGFADNTGLIRVGTFDHASSAVVLTTIGGPTSAPDQHNSPGLLRRSSDGRFVSMFCDHNSPTIYRRISTNVDDVTAWGTAVEIDSQLGGAGYTYPTLFQLNDEANDPIYTFYRNVSSGIAHWSLAKSTDGGDTWGSVVVLFSSTGHDRAYGRCFKSSESRLDFAFTDGSYASDLADLYHVYYEGGSWFKSDGSSAGSPPFDTSDMTLVFDGASGGARFPNSLVKDGTAIGITFLKHTGTPNPYIGTDGDYIYSRWNGSSWTNNTIAASVGVSTVAFSEGGIVIDPSDIDHVILSKRGAGGTGTWRIWDYLTTTDGTSWSSSQISSSGAEDRYPWFIDGHQPELDYIWLKGTFTSENVFTTGIQGFGI